MTVMTPRILAKDLSERARTNYADGGPIGKERFTSREDAKLEDERMWSRTWNLVCRESEVRNVGDYYEFKLANESILLIRESSDVLRAVSNVCRHRGTHLKSGAGSMKELRCPFHGWSYAFDGALTEITRAWDFPHVKKEDMCLPSFQVDTWQGFVFVNLDKNAEPLLEYLQPIREIAEAYNLQNYYRAFGIRILIPCNWKLCQSAFFESYHFPWTHPQGNFLAETDGTHYIPHGKHGQFIVQFSEQGEDESPPIDDPRAVEDVELQKRLGHMQLFPNAQISNLLCSQWFPNGDDPDSCFMETTMMLPVPPDGERPLDAPYRVVDGNDALQMLEGWGEYVFFAEASNQDVSNLRSIQQGLKSKYFPSVVLSLFQESLIRRHLEILDEYLALP